MESQSKIDKWIQWDNKQRMGNYQLLINLLVEEEQTMKTLVEEENYWEAFKRLNLMFLYFSHQLEPGESRDGTHNTPHTMYALLEWISNNKELLDKIVDGIGADGYGISSSIYGMNLSVSFSSGNNPNVNSNIGVSSNQPIGKTTSGGMNRALRQRARALSPNANRSSVKNPNSPAFRSAANNRSNQMNRNSPAYRSSRSAGKGRK